jgi:hypothetical protein
MVIKTVAKKALEFHKAQRNLRILKQTKKKLEMHKKAIDANKRAMAVNKRAMEIARFKREINWVKSYKKKTGVWPEDSFYKDLSKMAKKLRQLRKR